VSAEKTKIIELIKPHLLKNGVIKASLFGSLVRNEQTKNSDIDLLVEFQSNRSLLDLVNLKLELEDLFARKVDIVTYNSIDQALKNYILPEQELFYEA
jgi:predicted nucleotidyltransferase